MPQIPMDNRTNFIDHVQSAVPLSGGGNYLKYYGNDGTAEALSKAGKKIGDVLGDYGKKLEDTENKLAAAEARNLYRTLNSELELRMADEPSKFNEFVEWIKETDQKYQEMSAGITARMSRDYRKLFEEEMVGIRQEDAHKKLLLSNEARVTANYNLFKSQWKDSALRGDYNESKRLLEENRGELISEEEYQRLNLDYERFAAYGEVARAVEANVPGIANQLKERNSDGSYKYFGKLDIDKREQFIKVAAANDADKRSHENRQLYDRLNQGEQISVDDIERNFNGKTSAEDLEQKLQQRKIVEGFQRRKKAQKSAEEMLKKKESEAAERAAKKKYDDSVNSLDYKIQSFEFSEDPAIRKEQAAKFRNYIFENFSGDGKTVNKLIGQVDECIKKIETPDKSYKNTFIYIRAKSLLDEMKDAFYSLENVEDRSWWNSNKEKDKNLLDSNFKYAKITLDEFIRRNPNATESDVSVFLDDLKKQVNKTEVKNLAHFWNSQKFYRKPDLNIKVGMVEDGWIFSGGDPADKKNWKKQTQE